jgi:predicted DNA-binding protein (MmcQ/YjbR family)
MPTSIQADAVKAAILACPGAVEDRPFGPEVLVFKVMGKMFALMSAKDATGCSLKADPHLSEMLRQTYSGITAGYHLNKRHWNTITFDADVPLEEVLRLVGHSYDRVVDGLPRKDKVSLAALSETAS